MGDDTVHGHSHSLEHCKLQLQVQLGSTVHDDAVVAAAAAGLLSAAAGDVPAAAAAVEAAGAAAAAAVRLIAAAAIPAVAAAAAAAASATTSAAAGKTSITLKLYLGANTLCCGAAAIGCWPYCASSGVLI